MCEPGGGGFTRLLPHVRHVTSKQQPRGPSNQTGTRGGCGRRRRQGARGLRSNSRKCASRGRNSSPARGQPRVVTWSSSRWRAGGQGRRCCLGLAGSLLRPQQLVSLGRRQLQLWSQTDLGHRRLARSPPSPGTERFAPLQACFLVWEMGVNAHAVLLLGGRVSGVAVAAESSTSSRMQQPRAENTPS